MGSKLSIAGAASQNAPLYTVQDLYVMMLGLRLPYVDKDGDERLGVIERGIQPEIPPRLVEEP